MKEYTISDIAKKSGYAKATVSRVINKSGYVKEETKEKILKVMKELDYTPSATARNLSFKNSNTVGIVFPEISTPFGIGIIEGAGRVIDENNLVMTVCNTDVTAEGDIRALKLLRKQRVCGVLFVSAVEYGNDPKSMEVKQLLKELKAPIILVDRKMPGSEFDGVYSDNYAGAYTATEALIKAGHKKIGTTIGKLNLHIARARLKGFQDALKDYGLEFRENYCIYGEGETQVTYLKTKEWLKNDDIPTGVFAFNNLSGKGFLRAVYESGRKVPEDIAYIGFDPVDGYIFGIEYSGLDRDPKELGRLAMELLLKRMNGLLTDEPEEVYITSQLKLSGTERYL